MPFSTADLYDQNESRVHVATPGLQDFGGRHQFCGQACTLRVHEDNSLVREALETAGLGRVLVVDGGGSLRCALVGDKLAELGHRNGWSGIIVNGCIRDARVITGIDIGLKALATNPRRSVKKGAGEREVPVSFLDVSFRPGDWVYADGDGILVSSEKLF